MEPMSAQDAMFLHVENDVTPMHIGGVSIFEGPPPPFDELAAMVARQAPSHAALPPEGPVRPARRGSPSGSTTPTSTSATTCATAPCPPGHRASSCGRWPRASSPSTWTAPSRCGRSGWSRGSSEGRWALLSKVHHCMVDGVAATDLMSVMFGDEPRRRPPAAITGGRSPSPSALELLARADRRAALDPAAQLAPRAARAAARCSRGAAEMARALAAAAPALRPVAVLA